MVVPCCVPKAHMKFMKDMKAMKNRLIKTKNLLEKVLLHVLHDLHVLHVAWL
jgi:hypothetical protein